MMNQEDYPHCKKLLEFNCPEIEIIGACGSAEEAKHKIEHLRPELSISGY
jgi:hypothetical protein